MLEILIAFLAGIAACAAWVWWKRTAERWDLENARFVLTDRARHSPLRIDLAEMLLAAHRVRSPRLRELRRAYYRVWTEEDARAAAMRDPTLRRR